MSAGKLTAIDHMWNETSLSLSCWAFAKREVRTQSQVYLCVKVYVCYNAQCEWESGKEKKSERLKKEQSMASKESDRTIFTSCRSLDIHTCIQHDIELF